MVDSITIAISDYILYSPEYFTKYKQTQLRGKFGVFGYYGVRYSRYPQQCKKQGRYFPLVHILERTRTNKNERYHPTPERKLIVQMSLPKLLYGCNLFDITEEFLPIIAQKLVQLLREFHQQYAEQSYMYRHIQGVDKYTLALNS